MNNEELASIKQTGNNQVIILLFNMHVKLPSLLQMLGMIPFGWLAQCQQQGSVLNVAF